jgi:hypothetical protein
MRKLKRVDSGDLQELAKPKRKTPSKGWSTRASSKAANKERMLTALRKHLGLIFYAATEAGISRQTHYNWLNDDSDYRKQVGVIAKNTGDFVERKAFELVKNGSVPMTIFILKTKLKDRGYQERTELSGPDGAQIPVGISMDFANEELPPAAVTHIIEKMAGGSGKAIAALAKLVDKADMDKEE